MTRRVELTSAAAAQLMGESDEVDWFFLLPEQPGQRPDVTLVLRVMGRTGEDEAWVH
jgi:hypothetical protein